MTIIILNIPAKRLRVRRVDETAQAEAVRSADGKWHASLRHGGGVANKYGYPADTEAALAVSDPHGNVVVWMARLPANKVTDGGASNACLFGSRALYDARMGEERKAAAWEAIKRAHVLAVV